MSNETDQELIRTCDDILSGNVTQWDIEAFARTIKTRLLARIEAQDKASQKPLFPVCPNCDCRLPEGCGGVFRDDNEACWLNQKGT